jgi:hypothetical protein
MFCDGRDLVSETLNTGSGDSSITRTVNYPPCADGKLTPSDFSLNSAVRK